MRVGVWGQLVAELIGIGLLLLLTLLHLGLWLWLAHEIVRREDLAIGAKVLWLLVIVAFPLIGLIAYTILDPSGGVRFELGRRPAGRDRR